MKHLIILTVGLGLALAQTPPQSCTYLADDLERTPQTLELGANFLTELVAWLPIEDAKSARTDLLRLERDPRNPNLLNLASKQGAKGSTDLFLKVDGRTLRFRLMLGTRTAPGRCVILLERPKPGQPTVIVRDPAPANTPLQTPTPVPNTGPLPAPPMETAAAPPPVPTPSRKGVYFGVSLGYPPLPVSGTLSLDNLWYGVDVGLEDFLWGLDVRLGGGYLPSRGAGLIEGYLVLPFSRHQPLNFYAGFGGGMVFDKPNYPFVGGLVGMDYGLFEGIRIWLEIKPTWITSESEGRLVIGGRVGFSLF